MAVETTADGRLPALVKVLQTGVYVGRSDTGVPDEEQLYLRVDRSDDQVVYRYKGGAEVLQPPLHP